MERVKTEGIRGALARRAGVVAALTAGLAIVAPAALADDYDNGGFEGFSVGDPLGQAGWTAGDAGGYNAANFDIDVVDPSVLWGSTFGSRALRMSNASTSGGFGNQLQSPSLADEAGETAAVSGGYTGGTRQSRMTGSITFGSATQVYQPGLAMSFSPDPGSGARMSYFRLTDQVDGLRLEVGTFDNSIPDFVYTVLASGLSRTEAHTLNFTIDFVDGEDNDILWASLGSDGCNTWNSSGTWEDYHRYFGGGDPYTVDSILMRLAGAAVPANSGGGFLFDDISISSSTVPAMAPPGVPVVDTAPTAVATAQHVDVDHPAVTANACQPVTGYTATLTPTGGGLPIVLTSATPNFDFDAVPPGSYDVTLSATNAAGTSAPSAPVSVTVAAAVPTPTPSPVDADGDGNNDGELATTGPTAAPLAVVALALMAIGFALSRRAARDN